MLKRKLWRDLRKNFTQFAAIFLMAFLGMWIYAGMDAESTGASEVAEKYFKKYNLADLWVMGNGFSLDEIKMIEKIPGVESAERRLMLDGKLVKASILPEGIGEDEDDRPPMAIGFMAENKINQMEILKGEPFEEGAEGAWIDQYIAQKQGYEIGDTIQFSVETLKITSVVKGIVRTPENTYYADSSNITAAYGDYGYAFLSEDSYPVQSEMIYNQIIVDTDSQDETALKQIKSQILRKMNRDNIVVSDQTQSMGVQTFRSEMLMHKSMGALFSVVFLLVAVMGIVTTMTRLTSNQRTQIGTLKALGFSKNVITLHYVSYGFWISLAGSLLGILGGYETIPRMVYPAFEGGYVLPELHGKLSASPFFAMGISVVVSTLVSFLACRKELVDAPAVTLRPAPPKKIKHSVFEKSKLWLSMDFATQWNIRDIMRNKARSIMGVLGVCGCTMLMVCAYGTKDSTLALVDWAYGKLMTAQNKVTFTDKVDYGLAVDYKKLFKGQLIQEAGIEIYADDLKETGILTVIDEGNYMHYQAVNKEHTELTATGTAISYKMSNKLHVKEGDFIKWRIIGEDEWEVSRINQIYRDPMTQGITLRRNTFEQMEHIFCPSAVLTNYAVSEQQLDEKEIQSVLNINDMKADFASSMEGTNLMISMLVSSAVVLGIIVLYNLGVLSFVEKMREIATLKVLGFKSRRIRGILQAQNIWITTIGILCGMPVGFLFLGVMCTGMSDSMDIQPIVSLPSYIISIIGTFIISVVVNFLLSGKVKTIDMVDALKGVE